jgi:formyl-CoA transferase
MAQFCDCGIVIGGKVSGPPAEAPLGRTALEWEETFGEQVPCCAIRAIEDMFDHPQVMVEGLVATFEHHSAGRYRGLANSIKLSEYEPNEPFALSTIEQDREEILKRYG